MNIRQKRKLKKQIFNKWIKSFGATTPVKVLKKIKRPAMYIFKRHEQIYNLKELKKSFCRHKLYLHMSFEEFQYIAVAHESAHSLDPYYKEEFDEERRILSEHLNGKKIRDIIQNRNDLFLWLKIKEMHLKCEKRVWKMTYNLVKGIVKDHRFQMIKDKMFRTYIIDYNYYVEKYNSLLKKEKMEEHEREITNKS